MLNRWHGAGVSRQDDGEPRWAWLLVVAAAAVMAFVLIGGWELIGR